MQRLRTLGPGILMASAAIGGSHLVASTQAGAQYGWSLAGLILLINLFKYPFFRAAISYTMATGHTLQHGYYQMGRGYLGLAFALNIFSAVVNTAALTLFSASLLGYFLPVQLPMLVLCGIVLALSLLIVLAGHFAMLNKVSKIIVSTLAVATVLATCIAWQQGPVAPVNFVSPSPWQLAAVGFLVVTMGWMPAPIEISCITSLWLAQQRREQQVTPRSALFDFNLGYLVTAVLALMFLALGVLVLHGAGESVQQGGIGFSRQLVNMYASTIGEWSRYLIAMIAFCCIFGSTITVIDGYSRALAEAQALLRKQADFSNRSLTLWILFVTLASLGILLFFQGALLPMLGFAMTLSFMTTPAFALLNHLLVQGSDLPAALKPSKALQALTHLGLVYLFGFLGFFIWWKWFM
ncbi:divalent metal cation transporter [Pseudaeromonas sp. ZJS20]|uniref:NRAMP family divalent metal transporter n=1 Tax=Pseudaeromonas aegiceratis TaxID=3153928 RepID=UPI00390CAE18